MAQPIGSSTASNILHTAALVLLGMVVLFPVYWMVVIALTPTGFSRSLAGIVPEQITFENFTTLFTERPMLRWIGNSIFVAAASSFLSLAFGASCGYALSRIRFRGSGSSSSWFWPRR
ncbi:hypothetical protein [Nitratireductor aquibiodomus]|uniref:hypothetical protein n=1 Tax=Nitratireductor aquibiodomus TaxID=204799 RepID=UPI000B038144|nr:hypothetical protein [Nitratireductor aquibiodomus]